MLAINQSYLRALFRKISEILGVPKKGGKAHLDLEALNSLKMKLNFIYSFQPRGVSEENYAGDC